MKSYQYVARDSAGQKKQGFRQGNSTSDVLGWLREHGLTPVSVEEQKTSVKKQSGVVMNTRRKIKSADLAALCWQLTTMVEGGIPITTALSTISEDIENVNLQLMLKQIVEMVEKGEPFSSCLAKFPKVFNKLSCALILAGETGGNLPEALRSLAQYFDKRDKLAKKVKSAMAYPVFVFGFIVLIVIFIMAFIVPRFKLIFDQIGGELPAFTQAFMNFYEITKNNLHYIAGGLILFIIFCIATFKTRKGHYLFCRLILTVPLIGKILSQAFIVTFCNTMATLSSAGVSVLEVFDILGSMTDNDIIKSAILRTRENIVAGSNISLSMSVSGFFPNMVVKMIQVGEESGSLSNVLERTSSYYERKVDSTIDTVMSLLEPLMIVTVGGVVLIVVLALYMPIFSMSNVKH